MNHFRKSAALTLLACATSLTFAGCGGGGDPPTSDTGGNTQPPPATRFAAAGFWGGPLVNSGTVPSYSGIQNAFWDIAAADDTHMGLVILPSGETWGVFITNGVLGSARHGQTQVTGSNVTINDTSFSSMATGSSNGFIGSVVPKSQLSLAPAYVAPGTFNRITFPTTYDARYDQPATLAQLAGTYASNGSNGSGTFYSVPNSAPPLPAASMPPNSGPPTSPAALSPLSNGSYTVTISSTGVVALPPDPLGCSGSGTATPRTDSNVFDLNIRFSGAECVLGNGVAVKGIAVVENGHLLMLAVPPAGSTPSGEFAYISN